MKALPLLAFVLAAPLSAAEPEVAFLRLVDEGSLRVSGARATSGTGAAATVVVVLENARGDRLFLRRAPADAGAVRFAASLGGPNGVTFTRRGEGFLLEAGGRTLEVLEAELARPTVRCWVSALVARADPKLLEVAAAVRAIREAAGARELADVFTPMRLLWEAAGPAEAAPRGAVRFEKGPFSGEEFERLKRAALGELGRP